MRKSTRGMFFLLSFVFTAQLLYPQIPAPDFEIVESIPEATVLDNPEIRNTPQVWLEMIDAAQKTIDIEQFYIANEVGETLEDIILAIETAAGRGVKVRVIADIKMAKTYPETLERLAKRENISVRKISAYAGMGGVQHSKYFIVDNAEVFLGSQNFDWRALVQIHEIGLRIRQSEYAAAMTQLFELDWRACETGKPLESTGMGNRQFIIETESAGTIEFFATASPAQSIPTDFTWDELAIVQAIDAARKSVYVQLLSYSPSAGRDEYYKTLDDALRRAAGRGVDVRLLCSDWAQHASEMPYFKSLMELPNITVRLSTIPELPQRYISFARVEHCKFMVVDDSLGWVGSSNWKKDYFYASRNVAVVVKNRRVNEILKGVFLKSWDGPYAWEIQPDVPYNPKFYGEK